MFILHIMVMPKARILRGISIVLFVMLVVWLGVGYYFARVAVGKFNTRTFYSSLEKQRHDSTYNIARWDTLVKFPLVLNSHYGYQLKGLLVENPHHADTTIVICHGIGCNKWLMMRYADLYLDLGFNVVLYDQRAHGESGGAFCSYGYFEKYDLQQMVDTIATIEPGGVIGAHGESMGAATVLQHAGMVNVNLPDSMPHISFYIADCPYSDLKAEFAYRLKAEYHLPDVGIVDMASLWSRLLYGFWFGDVSPIAHIQNVKVPILFIHGDADTYVPTSMSEALYAKKPAPKMLYLSPGANHAKSYIVNRAEYRSKVKEFLGKR